MELLKKTRKFNKLLQRGENVALSDIANLLCEVINANTYIVGRKGEVRCYSLLKDFECPVMRAKVLDKGVFPEYYYEYIMSARDTVSNALHAEEDCFFSEGQKCLYENKKTTIVPIYGNGERLGTLVVSKQVDEFTDEDLLLAEYAATVLGVRILHEREAEIQEETRKKVMVQIAFSTLSYSELEAIVNILGELDGKEGLLIASKIADRVGITRSVIVNALRKFESADLIETRSLGMKGTFIRVKNEYLFDELKKIK